MPASPFALKRLRSATELAEARQTLIRNGFTQCDACSGWSDEGMRAEAHGSARDPRCSYCGHTNRAED